MVYSFSFFVSFKNLLTYRKWPIGVDCQATRPLELEEVYHGFTVFRHPPMYIGKSHYGS